MLTTSISLDYFRTMETRLLRGRDFTAQDDAQSPPVAIVNEAFARRFWPGENPLGKRFNFTTGQWIEIVGVAQDGKYSSLAEQPVEIRLSIFRWRRTTRAKSRSLPAARAI